MVTELKANNMKKGPFKMKGYTYPGTSPLKHPLSAPSGADSGASKGTAKDADVRKHNQRHADGLPEDHGLTKEQNKRINN